MTPNYLNPSQTSPYLAGSSNIEDHDQQFHHQFFGPSYHHQPDASSSSHSFHFYFTPAQDQAGFNYHTELLNQPQQQQFDQGNGSVVACGGYDSYQVENRLAGKGLQISLGINEGKHKVVGNQEAKNDVKNNSPKWMSSKMKSMHKMKKSDNRKGGDKEDFQKLPFKINNNNPVESNGHGSICSSYNSNNPVRVCADCNTTKTPLWRSGPKGPKSLCNACGIRQRKARRALAAAAAAAAANGTPLSSTETTQSPSPSPPPTNTTVKIRVTNQKADKSKNNYSINGLSTVPFKKRCRVTTTNASLAVESSSAQEPAQPKKPGFEDFLINLSSKLPFHHVFPQDEKEAAILLMALSCGLVHG